MERHDCYYSGYALLHAMPVSLLLNVPLQRGPPCGRYGYSCSLLLLIARTVALHTGMAKDCLALTDYYLTAVPYTSSSNTYINPDIQQAYSFPA